MRGATTNFWQFADGGGTYFWRENFFKPENFPGGHLFLAASKKIPALPINNEPLGTVHYLRAVGAEDFEGATYFGKSPMGGTYFWRKNVFQSHHFFLRLSGKNDTKIIFENIFLWGALF